MNVLVYEKLDKEDIINTIRIKFNKTFNMIEQFLDWLYQSNINPNDVTLYTNYVSRFSVIYIPEELTKNKPISYKATEFTRISAFILELAKIGIVFKKLIFIDIIKFNDNIFVSDYQLHQLIKYYSEIELIDLWHPDIKYAFNENGLNI